MFKRDDRIVALLQQELAALLRSVKDPGVEGLVTLTGADLSPDRKRASVYFSVFGDDEQRRSTQKALERASEFLRHRLKSRLNMKIIPRLDFRYDGTAERAQRIENILDRLSAEKASPAEEAPGSKPPQPRKPKLR